MLFDVLDVWKRQAYNFSRYAFNTIQAVSVNYYAIITLTGIGNAHSTLALFPGNSQPLNIVRSVGGPGDEATEHVTHFQSPSLNGCTLFFDASSMIT